MPDATLLEARWSVLEAAGTNSSGIAILPIESDDDFSGPFVGMDSASHRYLLFRVPAGFVCSTERNDPSLVVASRDLVEGPAQGRFLALGCLRPWLNHLFTSVALECLVAVAGSDKSPDVLVNEVLLKWQELFERERQRSLAATSLVGLAGELLTLIELNRLQPGAVRFWQGPLGARHDFTNGRNSLEVKSSIIRHGRRISINGHEQLEPQKDGRLFLEFVRIEVVPANGQSLLALIDEAQASGVDYGELWHRLSCLGIDSRDRSSLEDFRFHVHEKRTFEVTRDFPRIVPASFLGGALPDGVLSLTYDIDLTGAQPAPLDTESRLAALRMVISG